MPLDHYVPQVHLKRFNSPILGERMYALRKTDLKAFKPRSKDICRIEDGSTNAYLRDDRVIEEFLKTVEPKYTAAVENLTADKLDADSVYAIAGFVAYILSCTPAAMRIGSEVPKQAIEVSARMLDAAGKFPEPPESLGGKTLTELLSSNKVKVTVDPKYPQAMGIVGILDITRLFGNYSWEVLINEFEDSPFFTSDYPAAIERSDDPRVLNRLIPLSPNLALRIYPDINISKESCDFSFSHFRHRMRIVTRKDVAYLNTAFVRCAETTVFYRDETSWVNKFIKKNSQYRIEPSVHEVPHGTGTLMIATQSIVAMEQ